MIQTNDGLYLNGVWVASPDGIAATYQGNDLTKPDTLECSYTNTFQLPDSLDVRTLTKNAEQIDAAAGLAFQVFDAVVIDQGEVTFRGFAELSSFSDGWNVTLCEEKTGLFEKLDRSIRTANLSRYDHKWSLDGINKLAKSDDGALYPCIDYGLLDSGELPLDVVFPACYVHTVVSQMLHEEGYMLVGNLPGDPLYKALVIPFTEDQPTAKDQSFQDDRKARAALEMPNDVFDTNSHKVDRYQPYNVVNRPLDDWNQGKLNNFSPVTHAYTCDTAMRVKVEAFQQYKIRVRGGEFEVILTIEKNGQQVARNYQNFDTGHNLFNLTTDTSSLTQTVDCQQGDTIRIHLIAQRRTLIGGFDCTIYNNPDNSWVAYTPDLTTSFGDTWNVARNLPDLSGFQLLKAIAFICGGTYKIDALRKELLFHGLTDTVNDTARANDWSDRISELENISWQPKIEPYGQSNLLKWKECDDVTKGYGDGNITVTGASLPALTTLFELPFSASELSTQSVNGYGNPVKITTRTVTRAGGEITINNQATTPRLLLNYPTSAIGVPTKVFDKDGNPFPATVYLQPCWFGSRANVAINGQTNFSLAFDSVPDNRGERTVIERYYGGLKRVLRRPRLVKISMFLTPVDIATLDLARPVRLQRVRIGSIYISQNYFYLNKIENYQSGVPVTVTLICFD